MPSNYLILCHPLLFLPLIFPSIRVFSSESALCIRWPKYWSFSFSISPFNEYSGLISFRIHWFDLLIVQGTLKSLFRHHSYTTTSALLRFLFLGRKAMTSLDSILKIRGIALLTKVCLVKAMVFPVVMYGCESWTIKKTEHWRIDALELWCWRRLLDCKEIQPVNPKGNQSWIFIGRTDAEAETPVLWPPHVKSWLTGKDPDVGRHWGQEEKGMTEDEMAGWHHRLDGHEFE